MTIAYSHFNIWHLRYFGIDVYFDFDWMNNLIERMNVINECSGSRWFVLWKMHV